MLFSNQLNTISFLRSPENSFYHGLVVIQLGQVQQKFLNLIIHVAEAGTITFILISDHIIDHCSKIDLRSYKDHIAVQ
jgi:hypothetical protein